MPTWDTRPFAPVKWSHSRGLHRGAPRVGRPDRGRTCRVPRRRRRRFVVDGDFPVRVVVVEVQLSIDPNVTELAAYGLALVGISVWMPGRRAITFREGLPPDILLDDTDGALRGVEVAGRASGGHGALRFVLDGTKDKPGGKRAQLVARSDIAEAHVSLWCADPRVSLLLQVKP